MHYDTIWQFKTARFLIALEVTPELEPPDGQFDDRQTIDDILSGRVEWFTARVSVYLGGLRVGYDTLGCCAYVFADEFRTAHIGYKGGDYFTDMVREAVREARRRCRAVPRMRAA